MERAPFTALAEVYDVIMSDVDYRDWVAFLLRAARARGWRDDGRGPLLDLGCGTGNATVPAAELGYELAGLDASAAMLAVARRKLPGVRFVQGDFETFDLGCRFALVYSVFDSLNNLLTPAAFGRMAARVAEHLAPGGAFVFDVNTTVGLRELWESGRAVGWAGEVYYNWRHSYDEATGLARVEAYCEAPDDVFVEVHYERPYDADEVVALLRGAGFATAEAIGYPDGEPAEPDAPRIWVVATR